MHPLELQVVPEAQQLLLVHENELADESVETVDEEVEEVFMGGVGGANSQSYSLKL